MIGLALVSAISVIAASTTASINGAVDDQFKLDLLVETGDFTPFSPAIADEIEDIDGVSSVSRLRATNAVVDGVDHFITGVDPATIGNAIDIESMGAQFESLTPDEFALDADGIESNGLSIGDTVEIEFPTGPQELTLASSYEGSITFVGYVMSLEAFDAAGIKPLDFQVYVNFDEGADADAVRSQIETILEDYPRVELRDQAEFKEAIQEQVNQLLTLIYGLLALAIIIAILGIVNTLALSVIERTREIGLLRAVGMTRGQLRNMIRWESIVIAVYGALLGVVVGVGFGVALQRASASSGIDRLAIPWVSLVVFVIVAAIVGLFAAWWPARRAAKLDVLKAITTE
jgi:putative ABC transport system permease protein